MPSERVNADLLTYKGVLTKLQGAKEIMKVGGGRVEGCVGVCEQG